MKKLLLLFLLIPLYAHSETTDSLIIQGQNAAGIFDSKMYESESFDHRSFGGSGTITIDSNGVVTNRWGLFQFDNLDTIGTGQKVDSLAISLFAETINVATTITLYPLWKPWYEGTGNSAVVVGEADDNCWYHTETNDSNWTSNGAASASDTGHYNRTDGLGKDRRATAIASFAVTVGTNTWYRVVLPGSYCDSLYQEIIPNYGWLLWQTSSGANSFTSSEGSTTADRPKVTIYYQEAVSPPAHSRRIPILKR
jgi:hypothetical protein